MLGVAGLPNSITASQRFPLPQMVWGGTASWNDNTFASGGLPRRLPSDSDHFRHPVEYPPQSAVLVSLYGAVQLPPT